MLISVWGDMRAVKKGLWQSHFNPSFFTVLAEPTGINLNIKTQTATTFTTERVTKGDKIHWLPSAMVPQPFSRQSLLPVSPFSFIYLVQSNGCIPFLTCFFYFECQDVTQQAKTDNTDFKNTRQALGWHHHHHHMTRCYQDSNGLTRRQEWWK